MIKQLIVSIVFFALIPGCASTGQSSGESMTPPAWVTEPPKDTVLKMWGIGEGGDLENAKRAALKSIAAQLRVAISAQLEARVTVSGGSVNSYAKTRVSEDVQRTEFKNYTVEKSAPSKQGFYVLISVDRRAFIAEAGQKLVAAETEINLRLAGVDGKNPIERFVAQQKALPWLEKAVAMAQVLSAADVSFDGSRARKWEAIFAKAQAASSELVFDLKAKNESRDVAQTLKNFLNESGMRVGSGGTVLQVESAVTQDQVFGSLIVQLRINFSVLDGQGRNLTSKEWVVNGASMSSHVAARLAALNALSEKLKEVGALAALGFNP